MYFSNYRKHRNMQLRRSLFWEYDMNNFDFYQMKSIVVQRVIERGLTEDY